MSEIKEIHEPFRKYLKESDIMFINRNCFNNKRDSHDGYADFIIFLSNGQTIFIEFKQPEKLKCKYNGMSDNQIKKFIELKKRGFDCYVLDNVHTAKIIVRNYILQG